MEAFVNPLPEEHQCSQPSSEASVRSQSYEMLEAGRAPGSETPDLRFQRLRYSVLPARCELHKWAPRQLFLEPGSGLWLLEGGLWWGRKKDADYPTFSGSAVIVPGMAGSAAQVPADIPGVFWGAAP